MATTNHRNPSVTVLEYGLIGDTIHAGLETGQREFEAAEISSAADVDVSKVFETMKHLSEKHGHVSESGVGRWTIDVSE